MRHIYSMILVFQWRRTDVKTEQHHATCYRVWCKLLAMEVKVISTRLLFYQLPHQHYSKTCAGNASFNVHNKDWWSVAGASFESHDKNI